MTKVSIYLKTKILIYFFFSGRLTGETEEEREEDEIVVGKEAEASLR